MDATKFGSLSIARKQPGDARSYEIHFGDTSMTVRPRAAQKGS